jgi:hypothetical protein
MFVTSYPLLYDYAFEVGSIAFCETTRGLWRVPDSRVLSRRKGVGKGGSTGSEVALCACVFYSSFKCISYDPSASTWVIQNSLIPVEVVQLSKTVSPIVAYYAGLAILQASPSDLVDVQALDHLMAGIVSVRS